MRRLEREYRLAVEETARVVSGATARFDPPEGDPRPLEYAPSRRRRGVAGHRRRPLADRRVIYPPFHHDVHEQPGDAWVQSQAYRAEIELADLPYDYHDVVRIAGINDEYY